MDSLAALKAFPCPKGSECTAFQCLFKHDWDVKVEKEKKAEEESSSKKQESLPPTTPARRQASIDLPRQPKRVKTEPDVILNSKPKSTEPPSQTVISKTNTATESNDLLVASCTVSAKNIPKTAAPPKAAAKGPTKPETLNPRHLARAPAQHAFRSKILTALHEQYQRLNRELKKSVAKDEADLIISDQALIVKALDDEQDIATKKYSTYSNTIKNRILQYKKMSVAQWKNERVAAVKEAKGEKNNMTAVAHKTIDTGLTTEQELAFLPRLSKPLGEYSQFGYVTEIPKDEDIRDAAMAVAISGNTEVCDRCKSRFAVFPGRREKDGALTTNGRCTHHPGKTYYLDRRLGDKSEPDKKYRCCQQRVGDTAGCVTSEHHVFKTDDRNRLAWLINFRKTPENPQVPADRAVCFDCEMGYTVFGLELIRLTAVDWLSGALLLDVLVQPIGEILDINTRYSGVTIKDMVEGERWKPGDGDPNPKPSDATDSGKPSQAKLKVVPSPRDARDLLFELISPTTPLIGHGTENDLNSLRIIHPTVIDTVLLYPHRRGLPMRNSLKVLMEIRLNRKIQVEVLDENGVPQGHDSAEDAIAAGQLVRLKIKDEWRDLKLKGWKVEGTEFIPPP